MILFNETAKTVDFSHSGDIAQLRRHHPVLKGAQFDRVEFIAVESVLKNFAESGADRRHFGFRAGR